MVDGSGAAQAERVEVAPAPDPHAGWLVCAIWREISPKADDPTRSLVPATVYGCLNVVLGAEVRLGQSPGQALPRCFVTGPLSAPLETWADPGLRSLSLVLQPWVFRAWFDLSPRAFTDTVVDAAGLPRLARPQMVRALTGAAARREALPDALAMLCSGSEDAAQEQIRPLVDSLTRCRTVAAAAAACGLSPRQYERRFAASYGLPPRTWLTIRRLESLLHGVVGTSDPLAALAAESGYADQAHMGRDFRRIVGVAPLRARVAVSRRGDGWWALEPARPGVLRRDESG